MQEGVSILGDLDISRTGHQPRTERLVSKRSSRALDLHFHRAFRDRDLS